MNHIAKSVTFRDVNVASGKIMKRSHSLREIIPVTYRSSSDPYVYIVPNDIDAIKELIDKLNEKEQDAKLKSDAARERIMAAVRPMGGEPATSLEEMRSQESY